jgi:nucleoside-diphosphate-sugar epimerase
MNIDDGRALPLFVCQTLTGKTITLYGDGKQTRSFCYVDDLVDGIIKTLDCANADSLPVNLGNPYEITLLELLENIKKISGKLPDVKYMDLPADDPQRRRPDISRAKKLLNWEPKVSLAQGLPKIYNYYRSKIQ